MSEIDRIHPSPDHVDSAVDMAVRRMFSFDYADRPVNLYEEGLKLVQHFMTLTDRDALLDVGCHSGRYIIEAAMATGTPAFLIGIDRDDEPHRVFLPQSIDQTRFSFMRAKGEAIPLPDNAVKVVTAHNVLFRADDPLDMLREMKRVTEPGGLIILSTNAKKHAIRRHLFESMIGIWVSQADNILIPSLPAPAHGCYAEDIPTIVSKAGGLEILHVLSQRGDTVIEPGDSLETYIYSLKLSANRISDDPEIRRRWREIVEQKIRPIVQGQFNRQQAKGRPQKFYDPIDRSLFVLRNIKPPA